MHAPLYPGHGRTVDQFFTSSASDWIDCARAALAALQARCTSVSVVGLSMGAAIGAILAADTREISTLVMIAPYIRMPLRIRLAVAVHPLWEPFAGAINARHPGSIQDPAERERYLAHRVVRGRVLAELGRVAKRARRALPRVGCPTLVIQSRQDPRVSPAAAAAVARRIGAKEKRLVWTESGGHVLTVDYGRDKVFAETLSWISERGEQPCREATRLPRGR